MNRIVKKWTGAYITPIGQMYWYALEGGVEIGDTLDREIGSEISDRELIDDYGVDYIN